MSYYQIVQDSIFCVICNEYYLSNQEQSHLETHRKRYQHNYRKQSKIKNLHQIEEKNVESYQKDDKQNNKDDKVKIVEKVDVMNEQVNEKINEQNVAENEKIFIKDFDQISTIKMQTDQNSSQLSIPEEFSRQSYKIQVKAQSIQNSHKMMLKNTKTMQLIFPPNEGNNFPKTKQKKFIQVQRPIIQQQSLFNDTDFDKKQSQQSTIKSKKIDESKNEQQQKQLYQNQYKNFTEYSKQYSLSFEAKCLTDKNYQRIIQIDYFPSTLNQNNHIFDKNLTQKQSQKQSKHKSEVYIKQMSNFSIPMKKRQKVPTNILAQQTQF